MTETIANQEAHVQQAAESIENDLNGKIIEEQFESTDEKEGDETSTENVSSENVNEE